MRSWNNFEFGRRKVCKNFAERKKKVEFLAGKKEENLITCDKKKKRRKEKSDFVERAKKSVGRKFFCIFVNSSIDSRIFPLKFDCARRSDKKIHLHFVYLF